VKKYVRDKKPQGSISPMKVAATITRLDATLPSVLRPLVAVINRLATRDSRFRREESSALTHP